MSLLNVYFINFHGSYFLDDDGYQKAPETSYWTWFTEKNAGVGKLMLESLVYDKSSAHELGTIMI